jgi:predicted metal-binding membrane protein
VRLNEPLELPKPAGSLIERALRRDRLLVILCLLLTVVLSWAYLFAGAGMMEEMGDMVMPMSSGPWTPGHALLVLAMWAVMMAAMMLPSASPMILLFATIARRSSERGEPATASGAFTLGYLTVWATFSVVAAALQFGLEKAALLSPMMETTSIALAGALLIAAGVYQWTRLKQTCLRYCRSPLEFITLHWRPGTRGAFMMGLRHGAVCVGCCWLLMLLLFVGGVMNFAWIGGIALFVLAEKLLPAGHWIGKGVGVLLVVWGAATLLSAS